MSIKAFINPVLHVLVVSKITFPFSKWKFQFFYFHTSVGCLRAEKIYFSFTFPVVWLFFCDCNNNLFYVLLVIMFKTGYFSFPQIAYFSFLFLLWIESERGILELPNSKVTFKLSKLTLNSFMTKVPINGMVSTQ